MTRPAKQFGRVGILMGGVSSERDVSLKSGAAVADALLRQGCDVVRLDITDGDIEKIAASVQEAQIDAAFIALHGRLGEDGTIQSVLEDLKVPYTGSGVDASRLAINKTLAQNIFKNHGIRVAAYVTLSKGDAFTIETVAAALGGFPIVVKPACEGSSIGIRIAQTPEELKEAVAQAWEYGPDILLERYIKGRELTVGILGEEALPVVEIRPKQAFFNYEAKYTKGATAYIVPAEIPAQVSDSLRETALKAHRALGCADFSRVDFILAQDGTHYVLEVNTIPGFTETSLLPMAAKQHGLSFDQLCFQLMESAYGKKKEINSEPLYH